jgi:hypothetical protein
MTETKDRIDDASRIYLGQWNLLVSTTNWEKGRIIHEWRQALVDADAPAGEYSDDAWSRRVGNVTGQHVGRLRRVYERFGAVFQDYAGLYWSHFQAAIDWNDAEMWLEGAIQNRWSVADMRRERWQAFGGSEDQRPSEGDLIVAEIDEDAGAADAGPAADTGLADESADSARMQAEARNGKSDSSAPFASDQTGPRFEGPDFGDAPAYDEREPIGSLTDRATLPAVAPFADLPALPEDLSEAFESFKLAILRHKTSGWQEVSCRDVLQTLDALKALATAPE